MSAHSHNHKEVAMKTNVAMFAALFFVASLIPAATAPVMAGSQQAKTTACHEEANKKELQAEDKEKFLSDCLAAKPAEPEKKLTAQQEKMRECNREAREKSLKGDERRKFMSGCLKG